ncbi:MULTISPECIES: class I adenylate-forming enzyme family protein [Pseudomonas]|jgi:long-chain acyl-CoA synthetase|uniref:Acyl-CoA synthetase n=1 Tax=Pseudomonas trivialis TaxID=200450 RepID=A0A0R2ZYU4_9PSED|nr:MULTISPECIES: class I adenylate-forming enzyme family protein [Pseudomonas]KRP62462.1 acyl-CoA synthetase [Pseudomonas trivialis]MEB0106265.1 class I adenylate-forming enzyme family protein [Pseudomonas sp. MH9.3]WPX78570.1 class I adenylate-forming enzyme family protein [Pseudomonas sp. MH9.3]SDS31512.1 Acyl-CoA synthetase (AMP-forming)/AMP-acid ligase II [Pseudomonas trivialis]
MNPITQQQAWDTLFADPELGAGNFLSKSVAAYGRLEADFLFLEKAFVGPSGESHEAFSLDSLHHQVKQLAGWYLGCGVSAGRHVCLYLGDGIPSFLHFLALGTLGCVPVLINGHLRADIATLYAQRNRFDIFVCDQETRSRWNLTTELEGLTVLDAHFREGSPVACLPVPEQGWPVTRKAEDIIMVCHSSGTTGIPKAVLFGHEQFFNGKRERLRSFVEGPDDKLATAMPPTHAAGISYLMTAVMLQLPTLSLNTQTGSVLAHMLASFQPTIVTAFSQSYASLAELNLPDGYLGSIQRFYNTGDTAHEAHIRALLRLAPEARFTDMFGASELGMSQFFKVSREGSVASKRTVGHAASYARCDILSAQGELLPDGTAGYFGVRSPTVTPGYYGQPHLTALTELNDYWLTGDVGLRMANGEFVHLDRIVDTVPSNLGVSVYTLLLEEHLLALPGVFDVSVVGVSRGPTREEAVLILVRGQDAGVDADEVLQHAMTCYPFQGRGELPGYTLCAGILANTYALPAGSTGKILKRQIREHFWNWQRDFDEGDRSVLSDLVWNQFLREPPLATTPVSLLEYLQP